MRSSASLIYFSNTRLREASATKTVLPLQITAKLLSKSSMGELGLVLRVVFTCKCLKSRSGGTRTRTGDTMIFSPGRWVSSRF